MLDKVTMVFDNFEETIYPADLEHIGSAISQLKKVHQHTTAERLAKIYKIIAGYLVDDESISEAEIDKIVAYALSTPIKSQHKKHRL